MFAQDAMSLEKAADDTLAQEYSTKTEAGATARKAAEAVLEQERLAVSLFDALRNNTTKGNGIFRDAYGHGENFAHRMMAQTARDLGLQVEHDAAANTYMTMVGRDPQQAARHYRLAP